MALPFDINDPRRNVLSVNLAADYLGFVRPSTLNAWRFAGKGPKYLKLGSKIRYRISDLDEWRDSQLIDPNDRGL